MGNWYDENTTVEEVRDRFAIEVMTVLIQSFHNLLEWCEQAEWVAENSYRMADLMLRVREKRAKKL